MGYIYCILIWIDEIFQKIHNLNQKGSFWKNSHVRDGSDLGEMVGNYNSVSIGDPIANLIFYSSGGRQWKVWD